MDFEEFLESATSGGRAPADASVALRAMWHAKRGEWDRAHGLAQEAGSLDGDWVHAHLHRVEGDLANAGYWYRRCGKRDPGNPLEAEWDDIVKELLAR